MTPPMDYSSICRRVVSWIPGLGFSWGPAFRERACRHYLIRKDRSLSLMVANRTSLPASLNAHEQCYDLLYQNWRANSPYLFDKQDK